MILPSMILQLQGEKRCSVVVPHRGPRQIPFGKTGPAWPHS